MHVSEKTLNKRIYESCGFYRYYIIIVKYFAYMIILINTFDWKSDNINYLLKCLIFWDI